MGMKVKKFGETEEEIRTFEFEVQFDAQDVDENTYQDLLNRAADAMMERLDLDENGRSWSINFEDRPGWDHTISFTVTARR